MSIVPASLLSPSDLALLGNNLVAATASTGRQRPRHGGGGHLAAVNRSLAAYGERVGRLYPSRRPIASARP